MKIRKITFLVIWLLLTSSANAALIDNSIFTTDETTGLDWLDLSYTAGLSYNESLYGLDTYEGGRWRYATNIEVENIFWTLFSGYYDTDPRGFSEGAGAYENQKTDIVNFFNLFGITTYTYKIEASSYGLYSDENGIIRRLGASCYDTSCFGSSNGYIEGLNVVLSFDPDYNSWRDTYASKLGTFIVRDSNNISEVPIPATIWLFSSGLISLFSINKCKKSML